MKSAQIRSFSGPYFPVLGLNTGKYGREKTRYLETFHAVSTGGNQVFFDLLLESLIYLSQADQQKAHTQKINKSNLRLLINKTTCIRRHLQANDFLIYRILDQHTKSVTG